MKMKKILNEWRNFALNESKAHAFDIKMNAPAGWFDRFREAIDKYDHSWTQEFKQKYAQEFAAINPKELTYPIDTIPYYAFRMLKHIGQQAAIELMERKLNAYLSTAQQGDLDWLRDNLDKLMRVAEETSANSPYEAYPGSSAFNGEIKDWFLFGDAKDYFKDMIRSRLGEPKNPPKPELQDSQAELDNDEKILAQRFGPEYMAALEKIMAMKGIKKEPPKRTRRKK